MNGVSSTDVPPVGLFQSKATDAEVARTVSLVVAMLRYLNMAGTREKMATVCEIVCDELGDLQFPGLELFQVLRGSPPNVVWKEPGGSYVRVVEGEFSELLDEQEMAELLSNQ